MILKNPTLEYNLIEAESSVIFRDNMDMPVHRWFHYAEGFSNEFVHHCFNKHGICEGDTVFEPFMGSGTVGLCAKLDNMNAIGIELSPLMFFISTVKSNFESYDVEILEQLKEKFIIPLETNIQPPHFLKNERHYIPEVLEEILKIKEAVWNLPEIKEKDIYKIAFASILLECSNAKRVPSFGYKGKKQISKELPQILFYQRLDEIISDIKNMSDLELGTVKIVNGDSRNKYFEDNSADIAITSPPYANGIDYVTDYQLEMAWLDLINEEGKKQLRDNMVAYDKTRVSLLREFYEKGEFYKEENLLTIVGELEKISSTYWKKDIHLVILKYFDDMYKVFKNTYDILKPGKKFILVVGDSLMGNVYLPADILLAKLGEAVGYKVESIELARTRYSGQNRSYKLRETILTLSK